MTKLRAVPLKRTCFVATDDHPSTISRLGYSSQPLPHIILSVITGLEDRGYSPSARLEGNDAYCVFQFLTKRGYLPSRRLLLPTRVHSIERGKVLFKKNHDLSGT